MQRRQFIKTSTAAVTTTAVSYHNILGANDRVRLGLIGCGGRGTQVAKLMLQAPNVEYNALCDVYLPNAEGAKVWAGTTARTFQDFRKVLDLKDVDAVHIAAPDHWHAIPSVMACQAGKDVYVEKPLAYSIKEGRAIVEAARKYNRVVQTGMQHRSASHYKEVEQLIQSGAIGEVRFVRVWNYSNNTPYGIGKVADAPVPEGLDWDMYCGPAPKVPYNKNRHLRWYRWFWDYAGGTITDFGTHRFDTVHQVMHVDAPKTVVATGGRFSVNDMGEMPDVLQATYEYPGFVMSYEAVNMNAMGTGYRMSNFNYYGARSYWDRPNGEAYYGTYGTILCDRIGYELFPEPKPVRRRDGTQDQNAPIDGYRAEPKRVQRRDATDEHCLNFISCIRSRQAPVAEPEIGHRSTTIAHLGNIAFKTGKKLVWDKQKEDFVNAPDASKLLSRKARKPWDLI
ncbi:MAG TPA: Gfo/Idh/MocA family oxidoreductase [Blastocatellia bacterium]|nr:Gfo/Idh/MocA family oxidoreductase [Blastocatellia bacterium]